MLNDFLLAFIPMFFAMDALGILPVFFGMTQGLSGEAKNRIIFQSLITATILALTFIFLGNAIFNLLGISIGDFMIAGGLILFCIAIVDLVGLGSKLKHQHPIELAAVPIGTPLVVGPAVLTMALMLIKQFGWVITVAAVLSNILIVALVFMFSDHLIRLIGKSGSRALAKVMYLLLAAIGIMMIRKGILVVITSVNV